MDEADEFDAIDRLGDGGCRRGGAGNANTFCDCERPIGLVLAVGWGIASGRIFKCACSRLIGFEGDGLS
jgi:hypothetical protein